MISRRVVMTAALFVAASFLPGVAFAGVLSAPTSTRLSAMKFPESRDWVYSGNGVPVGVAVRTPRGMTLTFLDGREKTFDTFGTPYVAEHAGTYVMLTPLRGQVVTDWALDFYSADGKLQNRNETTHGYSHLTVSADGNTVAVAGEVWGNSEQRAAAAPRTGLVVYDATGRELARRELPGGSRVNAVAADGQTVAVAFEVPGVKTEPRWQIQLLDRNAAVKAEIRLTDAVQGMRVAQDDGVLLVMVPGGVRVFSLDGKPKVDLIRLPTNHHIAGAGRLYWRAGQLLAVTEVPLPARKGSNTWYLLSAQTGAKEFGIQAQGAIVKSRGSPAFSAAPGLGAKEWPVLVAPENVIKINPLSRPKS